MNKSDIVKQVAATTGLSRNFARVAVERILFSIQDALSRGERVELRGFGVFTATPRKARVGRSPFANEDFVIPAGRTVRFKPGKRMLPRGTDSRGHAPREGGPERE